MLEVDLRNYLLEQEELTKLINTRVYPGWIPKNAEMPSVAFFVVSGAKHHDIDVAYPRIQFSTFANRYLDAKKIAKVIVDSLRRYKGKMGNTNILQIVLQNEYDMHESDTGLYHVAIDFKIIYRE